MKNRIITSFLLLIALPLIAQNNSKPVYTSPIIHDDNRVEFNLYAPKAEFVTLIGSISSDSISLKKDNSGLWTVITDAIPPEIYHYQFNVDGLIISDPKNQNPYPWLDAKSELIVPSTQPLMHELTNVEHGSLHDHLYQSKASNSTNSVRVYTPPNYDSDTSYPVLFLLHGFGEKVSFWSDFGKINLIADNLIAQNKMTPTIIVMPNGDPVEGDYYKFFSSQTEGPKWMKENNTVLENDFINELIPYIKKQYNLNLDKNKWAIAGSSMGGAQAAQIGLDHLDQFGSVVCLSTWLDLPLVDLSKKDLINQLELFMFRTGKQDTWGGAQNEKMHTWLEENGINHTYVSTDGSHDWDVWRKDMIEVLSILYK